MAWLGKVGNVILQHNVEMQMFQKTICSLLYTGLYMTATAATNGVFRCNLL